MAAQPLTSGRSGSRAAGAARLRTLVHGRQCVLTELSASAPAMDNGPARRYIQVAVGLLSLGTCTRHTYIQHTGKVPLRCHNVP